MAGHIRKRVDKRTRHDGTTYKVTRYRARHPDPQRGGTAQVEKTFPTKKQAQEWLDDQRTAVRQGTHVHPRQGNTLVRDVVEKWRATWNDKPLAPKTQADYANILKVHVLPRWGHIKVSAVTSPAVQAWISELNRKKSPETVHHIVTVLRRVMLKAVKEGLVPVNPCSPTSIELPSKASARKSSGDEQLFLSTVELRQLVHAMPAHWRTPTLVAGLCGLRAGELWALRLCDVAVSGGTATLHVRYGLKDVGGKLIAGPTKTHESRKLTAPPQLTPALKAALAKPGVRLRGVKGGRKGYPAIVAGELIWTEDAQDPNRLLFTTPHGHPVQHNNFARRTFRPTVRKLWPARHRLRRLRWHDLRHTCASYMMAATGNLGIVQKRLGHSSIDTTYKRYAHLLPQTDATLAEALGALYDEGAALENVVPLPLAGKAA